MAPIKRTNRANSTADQDVCNKCSETIGGWIFCYSCRKWMHDKCCGLSLEVVQQITKIDNIQYVCGECLKFNEPINQKILDNTLDKVITTKLFYIILPINLLRNLLKLLVQFRALLQHTLQLLQLLLLFLQFLLLSIKLGLVN